MELVSFVRRHHLGPITVFVHLVFPDNFVAHALLGRAGRLVRKTIPAGVLGAISLLAAGMCWAAPLLDVKLPARDPIIGRPFPLEVIVTWDGNADDYRFLPLRLPEREDITATDAAMSSSTSGQTNRVEYVVHLTAAEKGEIALGSVTVPYRVAGSDEEQSLQSDSITFRARGNPLPLQILMGAVSAGSAVGLVLLSRSIVTSRRERRTEQERIDEGERERDSLKRLEELKSLRISGDLGEYLMGLAGIAAECGRTVCKAAAFKELEELAQRAKFSGYHPSVEELDSSYRRVERWVKRSAEQPAEDAKPISATNG